MPDLVSSSGDGSKNSIDVKGDGNQAIGQNFGNAFGTVEGDVNLIQQPKFLSLHQLPSDIADFTGRTIEIETIRQQLLGGKSLVISAVAGMPGVGKSALAIHVAQQLAVADYPDVQLYVDLRGADGDGLEPGDVLARWLRAFGLDESVMPIDLQERASVYRSQLAGKRAIVLLDNAKDEAQVRPLLPGNGCAVIITSRRVLGALDGATVLNLKVLSDPEARDLLAKLVEVARLEAEPEAAAETIRLCGGLPLAIRIVGGALKQKRHWSLAEYCQKLTDEKQRLAYLELSDLAVRASFELSYRELSAADGMLFSRLGILVGKDFGAELAAVVQESERPVIEGIERLIDAQLLEVNADRRYCFHDLLRLFAWEKLAAATSVEEQEGIRQQIVDWGCQQSYVMDDYLNPVQRRQIVQQWIESGEVAVDYDEQALGLYALAWFEQEREQLLSAVDWAKGRKRWNTVISLATNLGLFFQARSYWQDWEKTCLMAMTAAPEVNDLAEEGQSLNRLGIVYKTQSRWEEASDCFQQSLTIFREFGDRHLEGQALNNLGMVYRAQSLWEKAIGCFQQSLTIFREFGDRYGQGKSLNNLGNVYKSQSRWEEASDCFQQSLTIKQELRDRYGESASLNNLGNVYESQSRAKDAIDCYEQSLSIFREFGDRLGEGASLNNLGVMYLAQHQWGDATKYFQQSLTIYRVLGDLHGEGTSLTNLGTVYQSQCRWEDALDCYQQSLTIYRALGDRYRDAQILGSLGLLYAKQGQLDLAILLWQEALTKLPEGAAEYPIVEGWLESARHPPTKSLKKPTLLLIIGAIIAILLLVNLTSGHWIVAVVILGLGIGFWLLLRLWRRR